MAKRKVVERTLQSVKSWTNEAAELMGSVVAERNVLRKEVLGEAGKETGLINDSAVFKMSYMNMILCGIMFLMIGALAAMSYLLRRNPKDLSDVDDVLFYRLIGNILTITIFIVVVFIGGSTVAMHSFVNSDAKNKMIDYKFALAEVLDGQLGDLSQFMVREIETAKRVRTESGSERVILPVASDQPTEHSSESIQQMFNIELGEQRKEIGKQFLANYMMKTGQGSHFQEKVADILDIVPVMKRHERAIRVGGTIFKFVLVTLFLALGSGATNYVFNAKGAQKMAETYAKRAKQKAPLSDEAAVFEDIEDDIKTNKTMTKVATLSFVGSAFLLVILVLFNHWLVVIPLYQKIPIAFQKAKKAWRDIFREEADLKSRGMGGVGLVGTPLPVATQPGGVNGSAYGGGYGGGFGGYTQMAPPATAYFPTTHPIPKGAGAPTMGMGLNRLTTVGR